MEEYIVDVEEQGKRLDVYVASKKDNMTRTLAQKQIEQGNILVNGKKQKVSYKVVEADKIVIETVEAKEIELKPQDIPIDIIYEDKDIIVVNKPKGMVVHPANGNPDGTLVNAIMAKCKDSLSGIGGEIRPGIVHRLDKDTCGLMIVAKSPIFAAIWTKKIASKEVSKEYLATCIGKFALKKGTIATNVVQHGNEKPAQTYYEVVDEKEIFIEENGQINQHSENKIILSTVKLKLKTGRMHQIRIHLASINCPIAGDDKHGNFKLNKIVRKLCGIKALQLCAFRLTVPIDGKRRTFEAQPLTLLCT